MDTVVATLIVLQAVAASQSERPFHRVSVEGCVQATSDPATFLLAVPAQIADPDRGIATGEPVPKDSNAGPEPRNNPLTVPPLFPDEPGLRDGRYETRTMNHRTFKMTRVDAAGLQQLIGARVRVEGEIAVEGFPSGDLTSRNAGALSDPDRPLFPELRVRELTKVTDTCAPPF